MNYTFIFHETGSKQLCSLRCASIGCVGFSFTDSGTAGTTDCHLQVKICGVSFNNTGLAQYYTKS